MLLRSVAKLDGAIDIVRDNELLNLSHERRRVQVVLEEQENKTLDNDTETDNGHRKNGVVQMWSQKQLHSVVTTGLKNSRIDLKI